MTMPDYAQAKPINVKVFKKLLDEKMTIKEFKEFSDTLVNRFAYIVYTIGEVTGFKIDWYDYDTAYDETPGYFDTDSYKVNTGYIGSFDYVSKDRLTEYDYYFPTRWFYEDFALELKNMKKVHDTQLAQEKQKNADKAQKAKEHFQVLKDSILSKLTRDELSVLCFASKEDIAKKRTITHLYLKKEEKETQDTVGSFLKRMKEKKVSVSTLYNDYRDKNVAKNKKVLEFNAWVLKNINKIEETVV